MKRNGFLTKLLGVALLAGMLAACGAPAAPAAEAEPAAETQAPAEAAAEPTAAAEPGGPNTYPVTTEDITLRWWADLDKAAGAVTSLNDNLALQKLQEITGVKVEFLHPPVGSAVEQFNLLVASRDLPDMITHSWATVPGGPASYISDQVIIPLNDPVKQWAPNLMQFYRDRPDVHQMQEMDDGTYYVFPAVYGDRELGVSQGPVIRLDMFEKLGKTEADFPVTIEDWTALFREVKAADLGGGAGAVSPLFLPLGNPGEPHLQAGPIFLGAWGIRQELYRVDGEVRYGAIQPEYKEFLTLMRGWYEEGLLDPEALTGVAKLQDEKMTSDLLFAINGSMGNSITRYTAMMREKNPDFRLYPIPYPVLNAGDPPPEAYESHAFTRGGIAITTANEYVEETVKMLDYNYGEEGHILSNWGIEGETFEIDADGNYKYTELIMNNPDGLSREQAMAKYTYWQSASAVVKYKDVLNQRDNLPEQIEGRANWMLSENKGLLPPITATEEESAEVATILNEVRTYMLEMTNQFISGRASIEDDFDEYVETIKSMGVDRLCEITGAELARYENRPALS